MDSVPFLEIDFEHIQNGDIESLQRFSKESFEEESLVSYAEELAYYSKIKPEIIELLRNPSDKLIRMLIRSHTSGVSLTSSVVERFRPIVKNAITDAMIEMFRQGIVQQPDKIGLDKMNPEKEDTVNGRKNDFYVKGKASKISKLPRMNKLFEWGIINSGDFVYVKNHPQEKAKVINEKEVSYNNKVYSFNQWGKKVTGWTTINIYDWIIIEGQTETLSEIRKKKMLELKNK